NSLSPSYALFFALTWLIVPSTASNSVRTLVCVPASESGDSEDHVTSGANKFARKSCGLGEPRLCTRKVQACRLLLLGFLRLGVSLGRHLFVHTRLHLLYQSLLQLEIALSVGIGPCLVDATLLGLHELHLAFIVADRDTG